MRSGKHPIRPKRPAKAAKSSIEFAGVVERVDLRGSKVALRVHATAAAAVARGVDPKLASRLFKSRRRRIEPPDCLTVADFFPGQIWVRCRDNGCKGSGGDGCRLWSFDPTVPNDPGTFEGNGAWLLKGRMYACRCQFSS